MTMTNTAVFAQNPRTVDAVVTAAMGSVTTDAPTNLALLATAGPNGAIVTRLAAIPRATVTASNLGLFISHDGGVTMRPKDSVTMVAQTVNTTSGTTKTYFGDYSETTPLRLGPNDRLYCGSQVALAGGIVFTGEITDF